MPTVSSGSPGAAVKSCTTPALLFEVRAGLTAAVPMPRLANACQRICESLAFEKPFAALHAAMYPSRASVNVGEVGVSFIASIMYCIIFWRATPVPYARARPANASHCISAQISPVLWTSDGCEVRLVHGSPLTPGYVVMPAPMSLKVNGFLSLSDEYG